MLTGFSSNRVSLRELCYNLTLAAIAATATREIDRTPATEILLENTGPASAVDRMHTALHEYLKFVCREAAIAFDADSHISGLFGLKKQKHPAFVNTGPHSAHLGVAFKAVSGVLEAMGRIRNHASLAHANEHLLGRSEAMFMINVSRTVFNYIHEKIRGEKQSRDTGSAEP